MEDDETPYCCYLVFNTINCKHHICHRFLRHYDTVFVFVYITLLRRYEKFPFQKKFVLFNDVILLANQKPGHLAASALDASFLPR